MVYKGKLSYFDKIHFVFRLFQLIQKNALFTDMKKQQTQDLEWCEICTPESILEMIIYKLPLPQFSFISKATTLPLYFFFLIFVIQLQLYAFSPHPSCFILPLSLSQMVLPPSLKFKSSSCS